MDFCSLSGWLLCVVFSSSSRMNSRKICSRCRKHRPCIKCQKVSLKKGLDACCRKMIAPSILCTHYGEESIRNWNFTHNFIILNWMLISRICTNKNEAFQASKCPVFLKCRVGTSVFCHANTVSSKHCTLFNNQFRDVRASSESVLGRAAEAWQGEPRSQQKLIRCNHGFSGRLVSVLCVSALVTCVLVRMLGWGWRTVEN